MNVIRVKDISDDFINLIKEQYIESKDYKLMYDKNFLEWALYGKEKYIIEARIGEKLVGCVTAVIRSVSYNNDVKDVAIVNFLCVHADYRTKQQEGLCSLLKQELFKYVVHDFFNTYGIFTICYVPKSVTSINTSMRNFYYSTSLNYYHRPINAGKLVDVDYISKIHTRGITEKIYKINEVESKLVPMCENHMKMVMSILNNSTSKLRYVYTKEDVKQIYLNNQVVKSFVKLDNNKVVDFISIYQLPSKVKSSGVVLRIAYVYYSTMDTFEEVLPLLKKLKIDELKYLSNDEELSRFQTENMNRPMWLKGQRLDYYGFSKNMKLLPSDVGIKLV